MAKLGRPLKFNNVEELQNKIDDYFNSLYKEEWFDEPKRDEETGEWILDEKGNKKIFPVKKKVLVEQPTVTGLAIYIDTTRDLLCDYEDLEDFSDTIKRAKQRIRLSVEQDLANRGNSGDIFRAKNFGFKDKQEIDNNHKGGLTLTEILSQSRKKK